jgi:hypothetical protein
MARAVQTAYPMIDVIAAFVGICGLITLWLVFRAHGSWANDDQLTEIVKTHACQQVQKKLGKPVEATWVRVMRVRGDDALFALRMNTDDQRLTARAKITRRADGSVAIKTQLMPQS